MHYGGPTRSIQTAGSLVAHLAADGPATLWLTGTSAPCLGIFKPFYVGDEEGWTTIAEALGPEPGAQYDPASLWWQGEGLHRSVLLDYPTRAACFTADRDALETSFVRDEAAARDQAARNEVSRASIRRARSAITEWTERVRSVPPQRRLPWRYSRAWKEQAEAAGMAWPGG
jgi:dipeptidase